MSNNNFLRIAGIAGILNMVCWLGGLGTGNPDLSAPTTPLNDMFFYGVGLTGIVFTIGLYLLYRQDAARLNVVAAAISVFGYLVLIIGTLTKVDPTVGGLIYFSYSIGLLVWLVWTGIVLVSGKYQPRTA